MDIKFGIKPDFKYYMDKNNVNDLLQINRDEFYAITKNEIVRFDRNRIKNTYNYKFITATFGENELLFGITYEKSNLTVLSVKQFSSPVINDFDIKMTGVFHLIYSNISHSLIAFGDCIKVFSFIFKNESWKIQAKSDDFEIRLRASFQQNYVNPILNKPAFDYKREILYLPTQNGLLAYNLDGKPSTVARLTFPSNTVISFHQSTRRIFTSDTVNGSILWDNYGNILSRFAINSVLSVHFISDEDLFFMTFNGYMHILNFKTHKTFFCYKADNVPNRIIMFLDYDWKIGTCYENNLLFYKITIPWRVWANYIHNASSIERIPSFNKPARICVTTANSLIKIYSPQTSNLLTSATPIQASQQKSVLYDRGCIDYYNGDQRVVEVMHDQDKERDQLFMLLSSHELTTYSTGFSPCEQIKSVPMKFEFIIVAKYQGSWAYCFASRNGGLCFNDYNTFRFIKRFTLGTSNCLKHILYLPLTEQILLSFEDDVFLFDTYAGKTVFTKRIECPSIARTYRNYIFFGYSTGTILFLEYSNQQIKVLNENEDDQFHGKAVTGFTFSGNIWASSSLDKTVAIWDYEFNMLERIVLPLPLFSCGFLNASHDLLVATEGELMVIKGTYFNVEKEPEYKELDSYDRLPDELNELCFIPNEEHKEEEEECLLLGKMKEKTEEKPKKKPKRRFKFKFEKENLLDADTDAVYEFHGGENNINKELLLQEMQDIEEGKVIVNNEEEKKNAQENVNKEEEEEKKEKKKKKEKHPKKHKKKKLHKKEEVDEVENVTAEVFSESADSEDNTAFEEEETKKEPKEEKIEEVKPAAEEVKEEVKPAVKKEKEIPKPEVKNNVAKKTVVAEPKVKKNDTKRKNVVETKKVIPKKKEIKNTHPIPPKKKNTAPKRNVVHASQITLDFPTDAVVLDHESVMEEFSKGHNEFVYLVKDLARGITSHDSRERKYIYDTTRKIPSTSNGRRLEKIDIFSESMNQNPQKAVAASCKNLFMMNSIMSEEEQINESPNEEEDSEYYSEYSDDLFNIKVDSEYSDVDESNVDEQQNDKEPKEKAVKSKKVPKEKKTKKQKNQKSKEQNIPEKKHHKKKHVNKDDNSHNEKASKPKGKQKAPKTEKTFTDKSQEKVNKVHKRKQKVQQSHATNKSNTESHNLPQKKETNSVQQQIKENRNIPKKQNTQQQQESKNKFIPKYNQAMPNKSAARGQIPLQQHNQQQKQQIQCRFNRFASNGRVLYAKSPRRKLEPIEEQNFNENPLNSNEGNIKDEEMFFENEYEEETKASANNEVYSPPLLQQPKYVSFANASNNNNNPVDSKVPIISPFERKRPYVSQSVDSYRRFVALKKLSSQNKRYDTTNAPNRVPMALNQPRNIPGTTQNKGEIVQKRTDCCSDEQAADLIKMMKTIEESKEKEVVYARVMVRKMQEDDKMYRRETVVPDKLEIKVCEKLPGAQPYLPMERPANTKFDKLWKTTPMPFRAFIHKELATKRMAHKGKIMVPSLRKIPPVIYK